jgi:hypothetical protein
VCFAAREAALGSSLQQCIGDDGCNFLGSKTEEVPARRPDDHTDIGLNREIPDWLTFTFSARLNNSWVKMTACPPQVRFRGKSGWIFEQRNELI